MILACFYAQNTLAQDASIVSWDNGVRISSKNGNYTGKFGGRVLLDIARFNQKFSLEQQMGEFTSGFEFRRIRVYNSGQYKNFRYKVSVEFAKEHTFVEDLYVEMTKVPVLGNVRVGHQKEPFMLEAQSSSKYVVFMERGLPFLFSAGRNLGIMLHDEIGNSGFHYAAGAFRSGILDFFGETRFVGYNFVGRVTGIVAKNEDRSKFIHVGAGLKQNQVNNRTFKVSTRPETHLGHKYISTGDIDGVNSISMLQAELVLQSGPWSFQTEVVQAFVHRKLVTNDPNQQYYFPSLYTQLSYFVTGESRNLKNGNSGFQKVKPLKPIGKGGIGAIELGVRYSHASLNDESFYGGTMNNVTFGVNWYPHMLTRFSVNYVKAHVANVGSSDIIEARFQLEF